MHRFSRFSHHSHPVAIRTPTILIDLISFDKIIISKINKKNKIRKNN